MNIVGVGYARYSSDNQREESIIAQIRAIKEYAKNNGIKLINIYKDRAKSATTDKRPEFQQMIKDSNKKDFQVVLVHKLDRFARNRYDSAENKRKLKSNGVKVISITEKLDDSPESSILESLLEGVAEYYSKNLSREVMKGMKETAHQCKHTGGTAPIGYNVTEEKKYEINKKEAIIVKRIFDMYINGHSYKSILFDLKNKGYKTKAGKDFSKASIKFILENEKYAGVYVFNKSASRDAFGKRHSNKRKPEEEIIKYEGGMPQIVTKEVFEKAQEMIKKRKKAPASNKAKELYLLQGLIRCGNCGSNYEGNRRKRKDRPLYVSYRCGARHRKDNVCCDNKEIRREYIEEFVLSEIEKRILNDKAIPILVEKINKHINNKKEIERVELREQEKELKELEKKLDNIIDAIADGYNKEDFKEKLEELSSKKERLETLITKMRLNNKLPVVDEKQVKELLSKFKQFVLERNLPECKRFIHDYVEEVVVYKDHIEVKFNVAFLLTDTYEEFNLVSQIKRIDLFKRYSKSFYIKSTG